MSIMTFNHHLYSLSGLAGADAGMDRGGWLEQLAGSHFPVSFEEAGERLERLDRIYFEPDGSFVWVGECPTRDGTTRWQLDGMLYDHSGRLHRVELKGTCPRGAWQALLEACGAETCSVVAHSLDAQRWVGGAELDSCWESPSE